MPARVAPLRTAHGKGLTSSPSPLLLAGRALEGRDTLEPLVYKPHTREYAVAVGNAKELASHSLASMLMEEGQLTARLETLSDYFLMSQGDVFIHFLDSAYGTLGLQ